MYILSNEISFPPVTSADQHGFLAIGGDLSPERLLEAYRNGIFPWYNEDDPICWWSPDPRCVLYPEKIHISKSMQHILKAGDFSFTINKSFEEVIKKCRTSKRKEGQETWIHHEIIEAYTTLYKSGYALSAETWQKDKLVGGLYGIKLGKIFFGESMFSTISNASKFAFIKLVQQLQREDVQLIDCQMETEHLLSMGAEMIDRKIFTSLLQKNIT